MGAYWWTLLAFGIGVLAGFQGIHTRYPLHSFALLAKPPGFLYLLTRGAAPSCVYCGVVAAGRLPFLAPLFAMSVGASLEAVLRARVFIRETQKPDGSMDELLFGPFNLLKWYQDFMLTRMGVYVGDFKKRCARDMQPPNVTLQELCDRIEDRLDLLPNEEQRHKGTDVVQRVRAETIDEERAKERLVLGLLNEVDERQLAQLIVSEHAET